MSDYPSWSDDRESYTEATWTASSTMPPPPPQYSVYPGADVYSNPANINRGSAGYGGYENRGSAGYGTTSSGGGYSASYGDSAPFTVKPKTSDISYDTSSRDPALLRARVFIGSLGRGPIVREDIIELCKPFGSLTAVTLFKQGYAFVQFEQAEDADNACEVLNGKRWKGVNIDVHLAMEGLVRKTLPQKRAAESTRGGGRGGGIIGRGGGASGTSQSGNDWPGAAAAKKPRSGSVGLTTDEQYLDINEQNKKSAQADNGVPDMIGTEMADTLICGTCRFVTSDFVAFREHRKKQCVKPKDNVEPPVLRCASCGLRFLSAWKMLFHLTDFHRMQLFKPEYSEEAQDRARLEDDKYKNISSSRMELWKKEQENGQTNVFIVQSQQQPVVAVATPPAEKQQQPPPVPPASQPVAAQKPSQSFAADDDVVNFGAPKKSGGAAIERVTTGADYDEDEEDEDNGKPATIPTLGS